MARTGSADLDALVRLARAGDRRATGRLLSVAERRGPDADALDALVVAHTGRAHLVGLTGAPGAGKSTLTGALVAHLRSRGSRVGVLAVDPSSPISGGAILGDRVRMDDPAGTGDGASASGPPAFIRSMATRGHEGGLALAAPAATRVLDACGFDPVLVETAGVGQVELDIAGQADTTVVVLNPGWGDAVQAAKAGVLEVADVFVVNKADRPGTDDAVRDVEHMLDLGSAHERAGWRPPVLRCVATEGHGVDDVAAAVESHRAWLRSSGELARRRAVRLRAEVLDRVLVSLREAFDALVAERPGLVDGEGPERRPTPAQAAARVTAELLTPSARAVPDATAPPVSGGP